MQIMGRAARHLQGHVIMYADRITGSMKAAIEETKRRRKIQEEYNTKHGITPKTIQKAIKDDRLSGSKVVEQELDKADVSNMDKTEIRYYVQELEEQMDLAARNLEYEKAATIRDRITEVRKIQKLKKT
jgi:excinuclease ABC subunit B